MNWHSSELQMARFVVMEPVQLGSSLKLGMGGCIFLNLFLNLFQGLTSVTVGPSYYNSAKMKTLELLSPDQCSK